MAGGQGGEKRIIPFETQRTKAYVWIELGGCVPNIIIFAVIGLLLALRLYMVLGRRTGHEQRQVTVADDVPSPAPALVVQAVSAPTARDVQMFDTQVASGLKSIASADGGFDPVRFIDGARSAYRSILEAYWGGDIDALTKLTSADVRETFAEAIAERTAAGLKLDNRLVQVEKVTIIKAWLDAKVAHITVQFVADIAAVTRDADGRVIAGSLSDAVPTTDVWTFARSVRAASAEWILVDTDELA